MQKCVYCRSDDIVYSHEHLSDSLRTHLGEFLVRPFLPAGYDRPLDTQMGCPFHVRRVP
jgi:hypothetical protein